MSTTILDTGDKLPNFAFDATNNTQGNLAELKGHWTVIYFYPKDNTPGCTMEAKDIRDHWDDFTSKNTHVYGVSMDSMKKHENFKAKQSMPFELISDPEAKLCELFGVYQEKSMFGKKYMGIVRSTFLINPEGVITKSWRKVKVKGHAIDILSAIAV